MPKGGLEIVIKPKHRPMFGDEMDDEAPEGEGESEGDDEEMALAAAEEAMAAMEKKDAAGFLEAMRALMPFCQ